MHILIVVYLVHSIFYVNFTNNNLLWILIILSDNQGFQIVLNLEKKNWKYQAPKVYK